MKTICFYTESEGFGYRENSFDWKVGDRILSKDGMTTQKIIRVVDATPANLDAARRIMDRVRRYSGNGVTRSKFVIGADG